jgi:hypothetical protein
VHGAQGEGGEGQEEAGAEEERGGGEEARGGGEEGGGEAEEGEDDRAEEEEVLQQDEDGKGSVENLLCFFREMWTGICCQYIFSAIFANFMQKCTIMYSYFLLYFKRELCIVYGALLDICR